jgi:hypothetical protein
MAGTPASATAAASFPAFCLLVGGALATGGFFAALFGAAAGFLAAAFFGDLLADAGFLVFLSSAFAPFFTFSATFFAPFGGVLEGFSVLLVSLEADFFPLVLAASFSFYLSNFSWALVFLGLAASSAFNLA